MKDFVDREENSGVDGPGLRLLERSHSFDDTSEGGISGRGVLPPKNI